MSASFTSFAGQIMVSQAQQMNCYILCLVSGHCVRSRACPVNSQLWCIAGESTASELLLASVNFQCEISPGECCLHGNTWRS